MKRSNIKLNLSSTSKEEAIKMAGNLLYESGYVDEEYITGMLEREKLVSTYLEYNIAIPHGESNVKKNVKKTGIVVLQFPEGIDYGGGNIVKMLIGIAGSGDEHLDVISNLAEFLDDKEKAKELISSTSIDYIYTNLN